MASVLPPDFYSPIFSALSDRDDLSVAVGEESQLIVTRTDEPSIFHFAQVQNDGENLFYEISIHYRNTLVKGREVVAIPGEPPQRWILEYLPNEHAFIIKEKLIFPTFLWNVGSDKKITIGIWEIGNPPKRQLFRIPRLEE